MICAHKSPASREPPPLPANGLVDLSATRSSPRFESKVKSRILVRSKAATSITIPYIVVHTPDLRSPSPVRVRGCRLVVARLRRLTRPRAPCNGHPSPLPGVAWRSAPLNVQTWANRGSSARWAAARGSLRSSRRALTRWAIGSRARPSSAVHSCSGFRAGHCTKRTRQADSEAQLVNLIDPKYAKSLCLQKT